MNNIENKNYVNTAPANMPIMFEEFPEIMRVEDVQKALHICKASVYKIIDSNELKCIRMKKTIRIPKPCLVEYVMGGQQ